MISMKLSSHVIALYALLDIRSIPWNLCKLVTELGFGSKELLKNYDNEWKVETKI